MDILKQIGLFLAKILIKAFDVIINPTAKLTAAAALKLDAKLLALRSKAIAAKSNLAKDVKTDGSKQI